MKPSEPVPVKLFCGILYSDEERYQKALAALTEKYGRIDFTSPVYPFDVTDYYVSEMGSPIYRVFVAFAELIGPNELARIKIECNRIEDELAVQGRRKVNLDPGYLDYDKVVLASAKYNAHKIYLDYGIYADTTMMYARGHYQPSSWAFPDFKSGAYEKTFLDIRAKYKGQLRKRMRSE